MDICCLFEDMMSCYVTTHLSNEPLISIDATLDTNASLEGFKVFDISQTVAIRDESVTSLSRAVAKRVSKESWQKKQKECPDGSHVMNHHRPINRSSRSAWLRPC